MPPGAVRGDAVGAIADPIARAPQSARRSGLAAPPACDAGGAVAAQMPAALRAGHRGEARVPRTAFELARPFVVQMPPALQDARGRTIRAMQNGVRGRGPNMRRPNVRRCETKLRCVAKCGVADMRAVKCGAPPTRPAKCGAPPAWPAKCGAPPAPPAKCGAPPPPPICGAARAPPPPFGLWGAASAVIGIARALASNAAVRQPENFSMIESPPPSLPRPGGVVVKLRKVRSFVESPIAHAIMILRMSQCGIELCGAIQAARCDRRRSHKSTRRRRQTCAGSQSRERE